MFFVIPKIRSGIFFEKIFLEAVKNAGFIETTEPGVAYSVRKATQEEESRKIDYIITFEENVVVPIQVTISLNASNTTGKKIAMMKRGEIALFWPALSPEDICKKKQYIFHTTLDAANANKDALDRFVAMFRGACEEYLGSELKLPFINYNELQTKSPWHWIRLRDLLVIKQAIGKGKLRKRINRLSRNSESQEAFLAEVRDILNNTDLSQFWVSPA